MRVRNFILFEKKSLDDPTPVETEIFGGAPLGCVSIADAMTVPAVGTAIRAISEAAASLAIAVVERQDDGSEKPVPNHKIAALLQGDVNDWTSTFELIRDLVATSLVRNEGGIAWVNRPNDEPTEIILFKPGTISVSYKNTGEPTYSMSLAEGGKRDLDPADIIHIRGAFDRSPLILAIRAITVASALERHAQGLFSNGARPATVIKFKKFLGEKALKAAQAGWNAVFGGAAENSGKTAVLHDDAEVQMLAFNSTDSQFLENRKFQILEIARAFRVPPSMLFELDRATWSNGEQQGKEFLTYCLEPILRSLESAMRRALFSEEDRKKYRIVFDRDDLTRASLTDRATAINSLIASETINPNEGRDWLGMAPYDGGEKFGNRNITVKPKKPEKPNLQAVA